MKYIIYLVLSLLLFVSGYYFYISYKTKESSIGSAIPINQDLTNPNEVDVSIYMENLEVPWEIAFIDSNTMLVTERNAKLLLIKNSQVIKTFNIERVYASGEGGLLGIAAHPKFKENNYIYLYMTTQGEGRRENIVVRYKLVDNELIEDKVILSDIRGNIFHNAGKIAFGPDGLLYITAGDALDEPAAQDLTQLAGKILRVTDNGEIPNDNPFLLPYRREIYSLGHRNPQGLTWDTNGNLWSTEHGQSGAVSGLDELNKIERGGNYGWPKFRGNQLASGFVGPVIHSGTETWAPGDTEYYEGIIYFTGLRGQALYGYNLDTKELKKYLSNEYGRLRAITLGPDGYFYISTSNRDGRGTPNQNDDKIIKVNPQILK